METTSSSNKVEDTNIAPDYNTTNVKKARLQSTLAALLEDPLLADVSKYPSLSDVDILISLELGSAMRLTLRKLDNTTFDVVIMNTATVKELTWSNLRWAIVTFPGSMFMPIIVLHTIMRSFLMIVLHFRIITSRTTLRCIFYLMLLQRLLKSILRGENIISFMV